LILAESITSEDMVAELPKAPEPEVRKTEPLIYPKIVRPIGWR
jgi:hypothetical protein